MGNTSSKRSKKNKVDYINMRLNNMESSISSDIVYRKSVLEEPELGDEDKDIYDMKLEQE